MVALGAHASAAVCSIRTRSHHTSSSSNQRSSRDAVLCCPMYINVDDPLIGPGIEALKVVTPAGKKTTHAGLPCREETYPYIT